MQEKSEKDIVLEAGDALIVVDIQNDFLPGGALGVPDGDKVLGPLNHAIALFQDRSFPVFFSRDWHPPEHSSFHASDGPWPPHCVQNTHGAEFHADVTVPEGAIIISKGVKINPDEYSAFLGHDKRNKNLDECLKQFGIKRIFVGGLATDYCVLNTALDGLKRGYAVYVLTDGIQAVNVNPGDGEKALQEMTQAGASLTTTRALGV
jgi:nicotinamidase/pyrazinamidase